MESIPPSGEPYSWGSLLTLTLPQVDPAAWAWPTALLLLFFVSSLAITAALAAFQRFLATAQNNAGLKMAAHVQHLSQAPERVILAGAFLNSTLHLLLALSVFKLLTHVLAPGAAHQWLALLGIALGLAAVLLAARLLSAAWGRKQQSQHQPALLPVIQVISTLGAPFVAVFLPLQRMMGRTREAFGTPSATEELSQSLDHAPSAPASPEEKGLLKAIVNFSSITVRQIMRARVDIIAFNRRMPFPALLKQVHNWGYSRVPVYSDGLDKIDGVLYVKDLLPHLNAPADFTWQNLIRTPYFVPESKKIDELLREFQERRVHMAIVVNEYGDTTGLLTLEDVIEEIVGEIHDELDDEEDRYYTQLDEHTFLFEGRTSLHDFCKIVDPPAELLKEIRGEVESLAGLMLRLFSRIPHTGEEMQLGPYIFKIEAADSKKIKKVRVHQIVPHPNNEED
ncbi:transporter associated domain-containing protein [Rufibacter quisquiliarum]|uniref:Gliding motility-associated protein GldE n=1 Tax=Rufibacter quisquiliarum TaxID=1549639 RepID=A0A839GS00_9BACT|nr:transporter associated domain-containing protein [Rufibacter quisquiliarum]MBA9077647.1 gliding motility-associated protein GldE [Rufibacter quisquiliarum]